MTSKLLVLIGFFFQFLFSGMCIYWLYSLIDLSLLSVVTEILIRKYNFLLSSLIAISCLLVIWAIVFSFDIKVSEDMKFLGFYYCFPLALISFFRFPYSLVCWILTFDKAVSQGFPGKRCSGWVNRKTDCVRWQAEADHVNHNRNAKAIGNYIYTGTHVRRSVRVTVSLLEAQLSLGRNCLRCNPMGTVAHSGPWLKISRQGSKDKESQSGLRKGQYSSLPPVCVRVLRLPVSLSPSPI